MLWLLFLPRLDSLIERFEYACVNGSDDIHRCVEFLFGQSRFPCVRKAPVHSGIAVTRHRHSEPKEHLLPFAEAVDAMGVTIELSEICFFHVCVFSVLGS